MYLMYHTELHQFQMPLKEEVSNFLIFWSTTYTFKMDEKMMAFKPRQPTSTANLANSTQVGGIGHTNTTPSSPPTPLFKPSNFT